MPYTCTRKYSCNTAEKKSFQRHRDVTARVTAEAPCLTANISTCNKPGEEEAADDAVEGVALGVLLVSLLLAVLDALHHAADVLEYTETAGHDQVDRYVALQFAVVEVHGTCTQWTAKN